MIVARQNKRVETNASGCGRSWIGERDYRWKVHHWIMDSKRNSTSNSLKGSILKDIE